jgi:hypothetical protein
MADSAWGMPDTWTSGQQWGTEKLPSEPDFSSWSTGANLPYDSIPSYSNYQAPGSNDWFGKGLEALNKALAYKSGSTGSSSSASRYSRPQAANATVVGGGRGYTVFMPGQTQKTTQSSGSRGMGGALGTLAGIGISMIPGVGPAAAAAAPAAGGALGSLFG